ncbi:unnamed protein product, partial [Oppiella nova]
MRFYLVALLAVSATLYVADAGLPDVLIERARAIIAKAEADLKIIHGQGYQHLTRQVQAEIEKVRQLEIELQKLEKTKEVDPAKELEIENRLLAHENTLILEILKVQQIIQEEVRGKTAEALIAHAQGLIAHAEADLKRHKESGHVVAEIESEILALHRLVRELETLEKGKHVPPEQVFHIEIRMLHHENRLEVEVLRLDHEHKSLTPKLPDILIKRAQAIILRAEIDIHHHKGKGRLTHLMEEEVKKVRQTEMELLLLEHDKHLDTELAYHVEMALLQHEYFLIEESLRLELEPVHKPAARVGDLPEELIKRARAILIQAEHDLQFIHGQGYEHLTREVRSEIEKVRQFEKELQKLDQSKHIDPEKQLELENRLLAHENTLILEILKVEQIIQEEVRGKTAEALIAHAQGLIAHAEADLKRHKESGHVVEALEHEIKALHSLVKELETLEKGKHVPPERVFHVEIRMLYHENRLELEVLRLDQEHKSLTPKLPDILIKRAQAIILRAEIDIHRHKGKGRLTHLMEEEVHKVRAIEMELLLLEHDKHLDTKKGFETEMALLQHEYFLIEESLRLELEPVPAPGGARVAGLPDVLIQRARAIIAKAEQDLQFIHGQGYAHLTREVQAEVQKVRELEKELIAMDQSKHVDPAKELELENRLLAHENTLILEILKVEQIIQEEVRGKTAEALIAGAQAIIKHAEADLKRHKEAGHVVEQIEHEIKALHELVKELETLEKGKHVPPEKVFEVEIRMLTHANHLSMEVLVLDHQHKELSPRLPEALIQTARAIILRAEIDIHRHKGRGKLVHVMEAEVSHVRALEVELLLLEKGKHVDTQKGFEIELALLQHEYNLLEESLRLELDPSVIVEKSAAPEPTLPE